MTSSLRSVQSAELLAIALGGVACLGSLLLAKTWLFVWSVLLGAAFSSLNFRLLVWSWSSFLAPSSSSSSPASILLRILLKYAFLFAGMGLFLFLLRLDPIGFLVGLSSLFFAISISPLLPNATE